MKKLLFNYILYFCCLIFICIIGISKVFAISYTNIGDKSNVSVFLVSTDYSAQPFTVPKDSAYAFDSVTAIDIQVDNFNFQANTNYQLEAYLYRQQLTNANSYSVTGLNGETCLISYDSDKTHFNGEYPRWAFQCPHTTTSINIHIYNSAGNFLWSGTNVFTWSYTYLKSSTDSINSTSSNDSQNIIDNQNQNTQDIINNNNQNTQNIINNQNQNTQDIIDSQYTCNIQTLTNYNGSQNVALNSLGQAVTADNFVISDYIKLYSNKTYTLTKENWGSGRAYCLYNNSKELISCFTYGTSTSFTITGADYIRYTWSSANNRTVNLYGDICLKDSQEQTNAINNLDDTLKDDDISSATSEASDFFSDFNTNTFGLTSIITAPLNLIQSLTSSTCTQLHLPLPYLNNKYLDLPCMSTIYSQYFGTFFTVYQTITYGIIAYWVCVRIFNQVKDFKNPEHDEIEVVDL